ncbi:MAG TPA: sulfur carrier protein ThiS [Pyrinomonadaceae bacterium]|nr:sulfur carrier protein ThiS [Pyrinomonadaceae bacterium]
MTIIINGDTKEIPSDLSLDGVLEFFSLPSQRVAVELNKTVIPRREWSRTTVAESDKIEVIHFVGGG